MLWLDAHADYNTPQTTETGNMHGMSAAFLCGEPGLDRLLGKQPRASIGPDQLDLFGIRSIDPLEKKLVFERRVAIADMRAIDEFGVAVLIRKVIERVRAQNGVLHLSFDVDFLDPAVAPGVGTTVPGGATYREAHLIMELLHDSGLVRSVDIVELNPFLDERGRTARVAVELIGSLFGLQITDRPDAEQRGVSGQQLTAAFTAKGRLDEPPFVANVFVTCLALTPPRASGPARRRGLRRRPGLRTWQSSSGTCRPAHARSCRTRPCPSRC